MKIVVHIGGIELDSMMKVEIDLVRVYGIMAYTSQESNLHSVITLTKYMMSLNNKRFIYNLSPSMGGRLFCR